MSSVSQRPVSRFPIAGLLRRARRMSDMSQRQMARFAKTSPATVGKVETGALVPSLDLFTRLLGAAGLYLVVADPDGRVVLPMEVWDETLDGADRRYPSHLDTILDPEPFHRSRFLRERERRRSQWEVRVAKYRGVPPPPLG